MPGINVLDDDGDLQSFTDANVWHVDDRGQLHLNQDSKPVASFAKDRWQAVAKADTLRERPAFSSDPIVNAIERLERAVQTASRMADRATRYNRSAR